MKAALNFVAFVLIIGIWFCVSCRKETSCEGCKEINKPPTAIAGPDQVITLPTDSVLLNGTASSDPDGKISEWLWTKISGPASFNIIKPSDSVMKVKDLVAGIYQFELKVTDAGGLFSKDTVQVVVTELSAANQPPIAKAGNDTTILYDGSGCNSNLFNIVLNGSASFDVDGTIVSYTWDGPGLITMPFAAITSVNSLSAADSRFILVVRDNSGNQASDTIMIHFINSGRPIVQARLAPVGMLTDAVGAVSVASVGNKILFAGGWGSTSNNPIGGENTSRVDIYDIVTNQWTTAELSVARNSISVVVSGTKVFFAGGGDTDESTFSIAYPNVDIYDAATNTWSVTYLSRPASSLAGAAVGNKVFFAGGYDRYVSVVDIYDMDSNTWSTASLSQPRGGVSATSIGNKIYFAGGVTSANLPSDRIDIFDNSTGTWSTSNLIQARAGIASLIIDGKIYWAGGNQVTSGTKHVEIKDVSSQTSAIECLSQFNNGIQAVQRNNQIVFIGKYGSGGNKFDVYDIITKTWSVGVLPQIISDFGFISVNNTIYVASGNIGSTFPRLVYKLEF